MEYEGFRDAVRRRGFPCTKLLVSEDVPRASAWQALHRSLDTWASSWIPPLGILCSTDVLARYLSDLCLRRGKRIPEDAAVVGSGNTALLCDHLEPGLTSVDFGYERVGRRAAELLEQLIEGRRRPARPILVPPSGIQARRSTDAFSIEEPTVAAAMRLIWERSDRPLKVRSLLKEIPASRRTLERRFRDALGRTIRQEIERSRIERAKSLLVETRKPLKVIASASGFTDPQQFSRVFRKSEGRTPHEYRRRHRRT
jgi:LacI family transcriptional regulator